MATPSSCIVVNLMLCREIRCIQTKLFVLPLHSDSRVELGLRMRAARFAKKRRHSFLECAQVRKQYSNGLNNFCLFLNTFTVAVINGISWLKWIIRCISEISRLITEAVSCRLRTSATQACRPVFWQLGLCLRCWFKSFCLHGVYSKCIGITASDAIGTTYDSYACKLTELIISYLITKVHGKVWLITKPVKFSIKTGCVSSFDLF